MELLEIKNISVSNDGKPLFSNLSFAVNSGDYLAIVGENGSGKTTLMNTILGLRKTYDGEINFKSGLTKKDIGYLPQITILKDDFPATCGEIVISGLVSKMRTIFYTADDREKCKEIMDKLDISSLHDKSYAEISGGQRQRVLLARALLATKDILFLDEPVTGLDPYVTKDLYRIIKKLNDEGIAIVMISHDVKEVYKYATHILHIGQRIYFGTKDDYVKNENMVEGGI